MTKLGPSQVIPRLGQMALLCLTLLVVSACKTDITLKVLGGNPPTFGYSGSGNLGFFAVREASWAELKLTPTQRSKSEDKLIVWEIWPDSADTRIGNLPNITYGQIPPGFRQTIPDHGTPPPLVEGKLYRAGGPVSNASGGILYFTIRKGQAVDALESY
jgi:hypothetical protein